MLEMKVWKGCANMELLTIAEIAKRLDLPESSVRYYRNRFSEYVPYTGEGRSRRYPQEAIEVLRFIADNMRSNVPSEEVEVALQQRFSVSVETQQQSTATQQQSATIMRELIADALRTEFDSIHKEIAATRKENQELRELVEQKSGERDKALMEVLNELREQKQQKKKPWWKLF